MRNRVNAADRKDLSISTNIGERPYDRATACEAAVGVATARTDIIKFGLAEFTLDAGEYLGDSMVRSVKRFYPKNQVILAVFINDDLQRFFRPLEKDFLIIAKQSILKNSPPPLTV